MKSWFWILVILAGSLPFGSALEYYFAGEPYRNTPTRNWFVFGQALLGLLVMAFGLYKKFKTARRVPESDEFTAIRPN